MEPFKNPANQYSKDLIKHYPIDFNEGAEGNWRDLISTQQKLHENDIKQKKKDNISKALDYYNDLSKQNWEKYQANELKLKAELKHEYSTMLKNNMEQQAAEKHKAEQDMYYKQYLSDNYKSMIDQRNREQQMNRDNFKKHEMEVTERAQRDLLNEEAFNKFKKFKFTQEAQEDMKLKKILKNEELNSKLLNKIEYQKMCEDRFRSEEDKEDKYRKFFKDYEHNMNSRMKSHIDHVLSEKIK